MEDSKVKDSELNRTQEISKISSETLNYIPVLRNNHMMDRIMTKIRLSGGDAVEDVLIAMQKVEMDLKKYKDDFRYTILLPGPPWMVENIEAKLSSNNNTKDLFKALNFNEKELQWCYILYSISLALFAITILCVFCGLNGWLIFISLILLCSSICWHTVWFAKTLETIVFVKVYKQIMDVMEHNYQEHSNFVKQILGLPDQITLRFQEMEKNKLFIQMDSEEKLVFQRSELKRARDLQSLAAIVAVNQATIEKDVAIIRNVTKLNYIEAELGIRDEFEARQRSHESALILLDGIAQCLVESAKAFVNDQNEKNKIRYQMQLVNGIRTRLQDNGIDALYEEEFMETIKPTFR
jgi:hypothetical protein